MNKKRNQKNRSKWLSRAALISTTGLLLTFYEGGATPVKAAVPILVDENHTDHTLTIEPGTTAGDLRYYYEGQSFNIFKAGEAPISDNYERVMSTDTAELNGEHLTILVRPYHPIFDYMADESATFEDLFAAIHPEHYFYVWNLSGKAIMIDFDFRYEYRPDSLLQDGFTFKVDDGPMHTIRVNRAANPPEDHQAPAEVSQQAAGSMTDTSTLITFQAPPDADYKQTNIYNQNGLLQGFISKGEATVFQATGLQPDTNYTYTLKTEDMAGNESQGVPVQFKTLAVPNSNPEPVEPQPTPPSDNDPSVPAPDTQPVPGTPDPTPDTQPAPGTPDPTPDTQPVPGTPDSTPDTQPAPGTPDPTPDTQPVPSIPNPEPGTQPEPSTPAPEPETKPEPSTPAPEPETKPDTNPVPSKPSPVIPKPVPKPTPVKKAANQKTVSKQMASSKKAEDKKLKNAKDADKEIPKLDKAAKSISAVNGFYDAAKVGDLLGKYQAAANEYSRVKQYSSVVTTVSHAWKSLSKKVESKILMTFVRDNIKTSSSAGVLAADLKKHKLDAKPLLAYEKELKKKEKASKKK